MQTLEGHIYGLTYRIGRRVDGLALILADVLAALSGCLGGLQGPPLLPASGAAAEPVAGAGQLPLPPPDPSVSPSEGLRG